MGRTLWHPVRGRRRCHLRSPDERGRSCGRAGGARGSSPGLGSPVGDPRNLVPETVLGTGFLRRASRRDTRTRVRPARPRTRHGFTRPSERELPAGDREVHRSIRRPEGGAAPQRRRHRRSAPRHHSVQCFGRGVERKSRVISRNPLDTGVPGFRPFDSTERTTGARKQVAGDAAQSKQQCERAPSARGSSVLPGVDEDASGQNCMEGSR